MMDYSPVLTCCDPVMYLGEVAEWRHSVTCEVAPQLPVAIPHGHCSLHPSEPDVMTCRACIEVGELRDEMREVDF